jgi:hypothetical protein
MKMVHCEFLAENEIVKGTIKGMQRASLPPPWLEVSLGITLPK